MEPIKFILGEESRPKIETFSDVNFSLFRDQYEKAFEEISKYIRESKNEYHVIPVSENRNNIFAFIGERGSGKTSCMLSVANMLLEKDKKFKVTFPKNEKIEDLDSKCFQTIDLVDPSFFDQKHNILDIVIAKLFKSFQEDVKENKLYTQPDYLSKKQKLIDHFQKTKENLNQMLSIEINSEESIEQLIGLAAGVDLKENMKQLFDSYLDYFSKPGNHIVIKIDDIDLHTQHAYVMVEQIRKYLIQPNVIVLIAAKINQLSDVIRLHYTIEFDKLRSSERNRNGISEGYIEDMVNKYLGKLLPLSNRIFLPEATVYLNQPLEIFQGKNSTDSSRFNSVREAVPALIFKKTRYLFYNAKGATSYIVPRNLRELRHIIKLLFDMNNYLIRIRPEYNKTIFKKYLFETWTTNNLDSNGIRIIENILSINDAVKLNRTVIKLLKEHFSQITGSFDDSRSPYELHYILKDANQTFNTSCGDLVALISFLEGLISNELDQKLLFLIKTIYSIKLYEYYDEITENQSYNLNTDIEEVFKQEFMKNYSNYEKLVAGSFINSAFFEIIPPNSSRISRSQRPINGSIIFEIIAQIKNKSVIVTFDNIILNKIDALKIVEFFALTTSRKYDSQDKSTSDNADKSYRIKREIYYGEFLNEQKQNIYFDITSIFYNITNIKRAYDRFTPEDSFLYNYANNEEKSLFGQLKQSVCDNYELDSNNNERIMNRLLSWSCIRNFEVLEAFITDLQQNKPKSSGDDKNILKIFLNTAQRFEIPSYDIDEVGKNHYNIGFSFLSIFANILDEMNSEIFNMIFSELLDRKVKQAHKLSIKLGLKSRSQYTKESIWDKLKKKNQQITNLNNLQKWFDEFFVSNKIYNQNDAVSFLQQIKIRYDGQS